MNIYKHILLATDLSDESAVVSQKAAALAKLHHAKLSLAHIVEYNQPFYGIGEIAVNIELENAQQLEQEARKKIKALAQKLDLGKLSTWVIAGDKQDEIVKLVEEHHIDLVVVGAHHHHGLSLLFGASLAGNMLRHLLCDIIVVNLGPL